jgi:hypothetical protein
MFCRPCIIVYQYIETNVMHFSFNLLKIKGLYMFRALLAHFQEALYKGIWSVGCGTVAVQPCHSQLIYTRNIRNSVCVAPPEDEQVMLATFRGLWFSINWTKIDHVGFCYLPQLCIFVIHVNLTVKIIFTLRKINGFIDEFVENCASCKVGN